MDKVKLFCMPHASASASIYYKWGECFHTNQVQIIPIEYQGHGIRMDVDFYENFDSLMQDVFNKVRERLDKKSKYVILGHSMGCYVGFTLEKMLEEKFMKQIIEFWGIPDEFLNNKDILDFLAPIIRNDFRIIETMNHKNSATKLNVPITVYNGNKDVCQSERVTC